MEEPRDCPIEVPSPGAIGIDATLLDVALDLAGDLVASPFFLSLGCGIDPFFLVFAAVLPFFEDEMLSISSRGHFLNNNTRRHQACTLGLALPFCHLSELFMLIFFDIATKENRSQLIEEMKYLKVEGRQFHLIWAQGDAMDLTRPPSLSLSLSLSYLVPNQGKKAGGVLLWALTVLDQKRKGKISLILFLMVSMYSIELSQEWSPQGRSSQKWRDSPSLSAIRIALSTSLSLALSLPLDAIFLWVREKNL